MEKTYELRDKAYDKGQELKHKVAGKAYELKDKISSEPSTLAYIIGGIGLASAATIFLVRKFSAPPPMTFAERQIERLRPVGKKANELQKVVVSNLGSRFSDEPVVMALSAFGVLSALVMPFLFARRGSALKKLEKLAREEIRYSHGHDQLSASP